MAVVEALKAATPGQQAAVRQLVLPPAQLVVVRGAPWQVVRRRVRPGAVRAPVRGRLWPWVAGAGRRLQQRLAAVRWD